jgi:hypothetical protein
MSMEAKMNLLGARDEKEILDICIIMELDT